MHIAYNLFIAFYSVALYLLSPFNRKAAFWHRGREGFFRQWQGFDSGGRKLIWFHCASLGEFEQGRPVIEEIKKRDENIFILLTFFSPSGFKIRKNYPLADAVCYLPADKPANARKFLATFKPDIAVFVKYEFWYNYIAGLKRRNIPFYLISANFRPDQVFFKWYGGWFRNMLHMYSHIFLQSDSSRQLLESYGVKNVSVAGDTRFDRVRSLAEKSVEIPAAAIFSHDYFTIVAGSTWPPDHSLWVRFMNETEYDVRLIIAPHEIDEVEIDKLQGQFRKKAVRYSCAGKIDLRAATILIIDNIGLLSSLYACGKFAYIGGGFGKGIHNILEACTYGLPVIFGPNYQKFREARELVEAGGAFSVKNYRGLLACADELIADSGILSRAGSIAADYVKNGIGASSLIADKILFSVCP